MQCSITQLVVFALALLLLVFDHGWRCTATSLHRAVTAQKQKCPQFMENLYKSVLKGRRHLSNVIHSNTAIDVKRWNGSFEAIFNDLSFSHKENLKRARLRINVLRQRNCSSKYTLRVIDGESLQVIDEYVRVLKHNGTNSIPLTKSLKKWVLGSGANKSLKVKIIFDSLLPDESSCHEVASEVSKEAYLITHTKPKNKPRRLRLKRSQTNTSLPLRSKGCTMQNIHVKLGAGRIMLPSWFNTSVCGVLQQLPVGSNPIIKEISRAVNNAIKRSLPLIHNNLTCCVPIAFSKLAIIYRNTKSHFVLQSIDNIVVTKCGCVSKT